jgi:hypothetical protein
MKTLFLIITFSHCVSAYSQKAKVDTSRDITQVANDLSYYWKLDSLANNGFRLYTYNRLIKSKYGKVYADDLLSKLGKPNKIRETNKGIEYLYYCFDKKTMPKDYDAPLACWYISFKFENDNHTLSSIQEGDMDL